MDSPPSSSDEETPYKSIYYHVLKPLHIPSKFKVTKDNADDGEKDEGKHIARHANTEGSPKVPERGQHVDEGVDDVPAIPDSTHDKGPSTEESETMEKAGEIGSQDVKTGSDDKGISTEECEAMAKEDEIGCQDVKTESDDKGLSTEEGEAMDKADEIGCQDVKTESDVKGIATEKSEFMDKKVEISCQDMRIESDEKTGNEMDNIQSSEQKRKNNETKEVDMHKDSTSRHVATGQTESKTGSHSGDGDKQGNYVSRLEENCMKNERICGSQGQDSRNMMNPAESGSDCFDHNKPECKNGKRPPVPPKPKPLVAPKPKRPLTAKSQSPTYDDQFSNTMAGAPKPVYLEDITPSLFDDSTMLVNDTKDSLSGTKTMYKSGFVLVPDTKVNVAATSDDDDFHTPSESIEDILAVINNDDETPVESSDSIVTKSDTYSKDVDATAKQESAEMSDSQISDPCSGSYKDHVEESRSRQESMPESFVVLGKGTVHEKQYKSISSSVSESDIQMQSEASEGSSDSKMSVKDRKQMFEQLQTNEHNSTVSSFSRSYESSTPSSPTKESRSRSSSSRSSIVVISEDMDSDADSLNYVNMGKDGMDVHVEDKKPQSEISKGKDVVHIPVKEKLKMFEQSTNEGISRSSSASCSLITDSTEAFTLKEATGETDNGADERQEVIELESPSGEIKQKSTAGESELFEHQHGSEKKEDIEDTPPPIRPKSDAARKSLLMYASNMPEGKNYPAADTMSRSSPVPAVHGPSEHQPFIDKAFPQMQSGNFQFPTSSQYPFSEIHQQNQPYQPQPLPVQPHIPIFQRHEGHSPINLPRFAQGPGLHFNPPQSFEKIDTPQQTLSNTNQESRFGPEHAKETSVKPQSERSIASKFKHTSPKKPAKVKTAREAKLGTSSTPVLQTARRVSAKDAKLGASSARLIQTDKKGSATDAKLGTSSTPVLQTAKRGSARDAKLGTSSTQVLQTANRAPARDVKLGTKSKIGLQTANISSTRDAKLGTTSPTSPVSGAPKTRPCSQTGTMDPKRQQKNTGRSQPSVQVHSKARFQPPVKSSFKGTSPKKPPSKTSVKKPAKIEQEEPIAKQPHDTVGGESDVFSYLHVDGLKPNTSQECLKNFIEAAAPNVDVLLDQMAFSRDSAQAVVTMKGKLALNDVESKIASRGIEGARPSVSLIDPPHCIAVSSQTEIQNPASMCLYFDLEKNGGELKTDKITEADDGSCYIVQFKDPAVVERLSLRSEPHVWNQTELRVSPCYSCPTGYMWDTSLHVVPIPTPVVVPLPPNYVQYLKLCEDLDGYLLQKFVRLSVDELDTEVQLICTLTPDVDQFLSQVRAWSKEAEQHLQAYVDEHISQKMLLCVSEEPETYNDQVWNEILKFCQDEKFNHQRLIIGDSETTREITLTGSGDLVESRYRMLETELTEVDRNLRRKSESINLKSEELTKFVTRTDKFQSVKRQFPDVNIKIHGETITAEGFKDDVDSVRMQLLQFSNTVVTQKGVLLMSAKLGHLIQAKREIKERISETLADFGVQVEWKLKVVENKVEITVWFEEDKNLELRTVVDMVMECVQETDVSYKREDECLFKKDIWGDFLNEEVVELSHILKFIFSDDKSKPCIKVVGLKKSVEEVVRKLNMFFDKNCVRQEVVKCGTIEVKFLKQIHTDFLGNVEMQLHQHNVKIEIKGADSVCVRGTKQGIKEAHRLLKENFDTILSEKLTLDKVAITEVYKEERDKGKIAQIEKNTKCLIQLENEQETHSLMSDFNTTRKSSSSSLSEEDDAAGAQAPKKTIQKHFVTNSGITIMHIHGEIGDQQANVIVSATSPNLDLNGGATTKSLLKVGTKDLQKNCTESYPKPIKTGQIAVVKATGALECSHVYLAHLPGFRKDQSDAQQVLSEVMLNCLKMASKHNKTNIAFCALGTGQLHYPVSVVARMMYDAVIEFSSKTSRSSLEEVQFILYPKDTATIKGFDEELQSRLGGAPPSGSSKHTKQEVKFGPISVQYKVESLANQQVDAILCSTSETMNLSQSGAAKELLQVGGQSLQDECKKKHKNSLQPAQVVEIGGGKLKCTTVFLTVLPSYKGPPTMEQFRTILHTSLSLAEAKKVSSLAMPVMGTGYLKYPPEETCSTMYDSVKSWAAKNPSTGIKTVKFILHNKDKDIIQIFDSVNSRLAKGSRPRNFQGYVDSSPKGPYHAGIDHCKLNNVRLEVKQGNIVEQQLEAIVISVNPHQEGEQGAVYKAAMQKSKTLADSYKKAAGGKRPEMVCKVWNTGLPAQHVMFVEYQDGDWRKALAKCLEMAEKNKWKQIALPVLGTGQGMHTLEPSAFAEQLFDAVNSFSKGKSTSLSVVTVMVFHEKQFGPIMKQLIKKCQDEKNPGVFKRLKKKIAGAFCQPMDTDVYQTFKVKVSSLEVVIYSNKQENIDSCKDSLGACLDLKYDKREVDDFRDLVKTLTKDQENCLIPATCLVNLTVDKRAGIVKIEGPEKNVLTAQDHARTYLRKLNKEKEQKENSELLYDQVRWCFEEVTQTERKRTPYEKWSNYLIEKAYKENKEEIVLFNQDNSKCVIDFKNLVEYPEDEPNDAVSVFRTDILTAKVQKLPETWLGMKDGEFITKVLLDISSPEYISIATRFVQEVKGGNYAGRIQWNKANLKVTKIERIQNKTLHQQYLSKKETITAEKTMMMPPNVPIERDLWHGTTPDVVDSIIQHGFNRSYCGKNGIWYGAGVYFAADASYSARGWLTGGGNVPTSPFTGQMFLVKTVTGRFTKGNDKMRYLPAIDPKHPLVLYDSAVDNLANPMEFVIFHDTQSYPAYLLSFSA